MNDNEATEECVAETQEEEERTKRGRREDEEKTKRRRREDEEKTKRGRREDEEDDKPEATEVSSSAETSKRLKRQSLIQKM